MSKRTDRKVDQAFKDAEKIPEELLQYIHRHNERYRMLGKHIPETTNQFIEFSQKAGYKSLVLNCLGNPVVDLGVELPVVYIDTPDEKIRFNALVPKAAPDMDFLGISSTDISGLHERALEANMSLARKIHQGGQRVFVEAYVHNYGEELKANLTSAGIPYEVSKPNPQKPTQIGIIGVFDGDLKGGKYWADVGIG